MFFRVAPLFILLLFQQFCFSNPPATLPKPAHDCIVLSLSKNGTEIISKLLSMIASNRCINVNYLQEFKAKGKKFVPYHHALNPQFFLGVIEKKGNPSLIAHLNFYNHFQKFAKEHPNHKKIIIIGDLRDICVATVYQQKKFLDRTVGRGVRFDKKLHYVINPESGFLLNSMYNISKSAKNALLCLQDPSFIVCRLEAFYGDGIRAQQEIQIEKFAANLGITLSKEEINYVLDNLWVTSGDIGIWKTHFKSSHVKAFKKHLDPLFINLGYRW